MKKVCLLIAILCYLNMEMAFAQSRQITGKVLDERGTGIPGAGIGIRGTTTGTATDADGNFQLELPEGSNVIIVQAVGYAAQTLTVTGNSISVNMAPDTKELQGAVVTALALKREKRSLGYGTTTLNSNDVNSANSFSALSAIQGKTAGVNITSSTGGPGGSTRVVMRGEKSLQGNNQAIIVVDGIPISNGSRAIGRDARYQVDFGNRGNDVDPDDIESMTILKGAVAAALYGEQASGGAIMITTKSGKGRSLKKNNGFSFSTSYTLSDNLKYPEFQNSYGQGDLNANETDRRENFSWGRKFDGQLRPWGQVINGKQLVKPYSAQPDNVKSFFNTGKTWENNFQMGGSNDKGNYLLSINTMNNDGVVPNTFYDKYGIRFNGSMDLPNKMYSSISVNYINTYQRVEIGGQGESPYNQLIQTPRDIPIWELKDYNNPFYSMQSLDSNGIERYGYYGAYTLNPYWANDKVDNRLRSDRVISGLTVGIRPNSHWDVFNRLGVDFTSDRAQLKIPKYNSKPYDEAFYFSGGTTLDQNGNGGYTEDNINAFLLNNDLIAVYNNTFGKNFGFNGTIGNNLQVSRTTRTRPSIDDQENGLVVPGYYNLSNGTGPIDPGSYDDVIGLSELRRVSLYAQAAIDYRKFLFLEVTGRNDWTSTLIQKQRSFFYPSASLSWVFSEHVKTNDVLSYGKLRTSYALTGTGANPYDNNSPAFLRAESTTGFGAVRFPFNGTPGFTLQNTYGIPELEPEKTKTFEIGAEVALWRNRINIDATYYNSRTNQMIVPVPMPPSSGFTERVINIGEVKNDGVELSVRVTPVSTASGFRWEVFGTYTKNRNEVVSIAPGVEQISLGGISGAAAYAQVGKPFGAFYATDLATTKEDGRVIVDSATGMPQIGANPVYRGSYQPRFQASWGTNLKYKGFTLALLFDTKQGGVFFSRTKDIMDFVGTAKETENRDPYVYPNSVYVNSEGQYITNTTKFDPYNYYTSVIPSGRHFVDASYVKWREASLSYKVPDRWLKRTFFGNAEVAIYGNNLFIWTAKENMYSDPEMNSAGATNLQGFEYSARMSLRNYGMRLNLTF